MKLYFNLRYSLFLLLFVFSMSCGSTNKVAKSRNDSRTLSPDRAAMMEARKGNYDKAISILGKELINDPANSDLALMKYTFMFESGKKSAGLDGLNTYLLTYDEVNPEMYFTAGAMADDLKRYNEAHNYYEQYLKKGEMDDIRREKVSNMSKLAKFRSSAQEQSLKVTPILLSGDVNTSNSEYLPSVTLDGRTMLFTRMVRGQEDLFIAHNKEGRWIEVQPVASINTAANEGGAAMSADGNTILFTACKRPLNIGGCDLYISKKKDGEWTKPKLMNVGINTPAWESQPCLSADGTMLFFSSNRVEGHGGADLWVSTIDEQGIWKPATNLGNVINTKGSEESPFLHPDGITLYFRSSGHLGFGGMDIFMSKYDAELGQWSSPQNLGSSINTEGDEGALTISSDGATAYYASDIVSLQDQSINPNLDIMTFEMPVDLRPLPVSYVNARILDAITKQPLQANAVLTLQGQTSASNVNTDTNGEILMALVLGQDYTLSIDKEGYLYDLTLIETKDKGSAFRPIEMDILLKPIPKKEDKAEPIILKNVYFESGSAELMSKSTYEIDKLYQLMTTNSGVTIVIVGHTDDVGQEEDNVALSKSRAEAIASALIEKGIDASRIKTRGLGESSPIDTNDTPEGRAANRRTEVIIKW